MTHRNHPVVDHATVVDADTQFVDVREPDEYAGGSIDGAVNIPLSELADRLDELDPARRTVLLCRSGQRSERAARFLTDSGFSTVINLSGGMLAYNGKVTS
ncbi:rhodanese-like domain-containing protein [Ilumatobacter coccineus]|uniref:Rhodanese domain-containing protein n=1 Tax=Ilumatobacter coccineus (strain NBRC 103263 / KCTC 29153 / YM16-304) TaxID=1313172 RepID=A0A6C7ED16_ILUCY|nr:rhodanese-like domain-containing protein [Ilumatobacter coccineus]BAN04351.1 hypothetical protein YM304_40370 [Ilumatobacter coccineus YM16-304]